MRQPTFTVLLSPLSSSPFFPLQHVASRETTFRNFLAPQLAICCVRRGFLDLCEGRSFFKRFHLIVDGFVSEIFKLHGQKLSLEDDMFGGYMLIFKNAATRPFNQENVTEHRLLIFDQQVKHVARILESLHFACSHC
jgi:hypothetical protein